MEPKYRAITGRVFNIAGLPSEERDFLDKVYDLYLKGLSWSEFSRRWVALGRELLWGSGTLPMRKTVCRICQDLAARLGIAEGRVAQPNYRECLADLIDARFKSRYELSKRLGIDQSHLSRVLSERSNFNSETLMEILEVCGLSTADVFRAAFRTDDEPTKMDAIQRKIDALKTIKARSANFPRGARRSLLGKSDLMPHPLDQLRERIDAGEEFDSALNSELTQAYQELSELAAKVKDNADQQREAMKA